MFLYLFLKNVLINKGKHPIDASIYSLVLLKRMLRKACHLSDGLMDGVTLITLL